MNLILKFWKSAYSELPWRIHPNILGKDLPKKKDGYFSAEEICGYLTLIQQTQIKVPTEYIYPTSSILDRSVKNNQEAPE